MPKKGFGETASVFGEQVKRTRLAKGLSPFQCAVLFNDYLESHGWEAQAGEQKWIALETKGAGLSQIPLFFFLLEKGFIKIPDSLGDRPVESEDGPSVGATKRKKTPASKSNSRRKARSA